jgi:hypothetical protein
MILFILNYLIMVILSRKHIPDEAMILAYCCIFWLAYNIVPLAIQLTIRN